MNKIALLLTGATFINFYPASLPVFAQENIQAGKTCKVSDPTGTLLNVRSSPNGRIVGRIKNGRNVYVQSVERDLKGKPWVLIAIEERGKLQQIGYVLREFIGCYE